MSCDENSNEKDEDLGTCDYNQWAQNGYVPWCLDEKTPVMCNSNNKITYAHYDASDNPLLCKENEMCFSKGQFPGECHKVPETQKCSENATLCYGDKLYKCKDNKYELETDCAATGNVCGVINSYGLNGCAEPCTKQDKDANKNWFVCDNETWSDYVAAIECREVPESRGTLYIKVMYDDSYEQCQGKCEDGKCL